MKKENLKSKKEIYICNFKRDDGENCFDRGAKELTDNLKSWAKSEFKNEVKVVRSGCLGKCSEGIAISCYPERELLLNVTRDDEETLKNNLKTNL